jgi:hypothetical protein
MEGFTSVSVIEETPKPKRLRRVRAVVGWVVTVLALLLVLFCLNLPIHYEDVTTDAFLRIPVEGLLGFAILLALPRRTRPVVALVAGAFLGFLTLLKILDIGFYYFLNRPSDPWNDLSLLDDALAFLRDSIGKIGATLAAVAAVLLVIGLLVLTGLAALRLTRVMTRYDRPARGGLAAVGVAWIMFLAFGVQIGPDLPVASFAHNRYLQFAGDIKDEQKFAQLAADDQYRNTPGDQLLTALRGKDVIFTFVESYGRSAIENPEYNAPVNAELADGTRRLTAAGFGARSAFLTSPTFGGGSWLAHSTFLSGLWINTQQRYNTLVASDRLTLTQTFGKAGWRKVGFEPGNSFAWPEASFYGYDKVYDERNIGYRGPRFSWSNMPDQFALQQFAKLEYSNPNRGPLLTEITLTSSHTPWAPLPRYLDWDQLGDGSVFGPIAQAAATPEQTWKETSLIRKAYAQSIQYSIQSLVSFVEKYGKKNLVLVFLGDHQPAPNVTGPNASHDVPITIVSGDPGVLDKAAGWGWQSGLKPDPQAPVWQMDTFRDHFLTTFSVPRH